MQSLPAHFGLVGEQVLSDGHKVTFAIHGDRRAFQILCRCVGGILAGGDPDKFVAGRTQHGAPFCIAIEVDGLAALRTWEADLEVRGARRAGAHRQQQAEDE